jgi:hypothetical protein
MKGVFFRAIYTFHNTIRETFVLAVSAEQAAEAANFFCGIPLDLLNFHPIEQAEIPFGAQIINGIS